MGKVRVSVKGPGPGAADTAETAAKLNITAAAPSIVPSIDVKGLSTAGKPRAALSPQLVLQHALHR